MRVLAVAVTYNPDTDLLAQVLRSSAPQVQGVVVVDNGSANAGTVREVASAFQAHVLANEENLGIAAAQNQGAAMAQTEGYSHILLLDQDTVLTPGVVADLSNNLTVLEKEHGGVAAIGPAYYELNSQKQTRAYRANGLRLSRISLEGPDHPVESDFIIASGSLIPLAVLKKVGGFKEDLFIDLVDVEWCFRARAAGYRSFLSPTAKVDHHLGSGTIEVGKRQIAVHVPIRNYYWVRNALWLARQPYTPSAWKLYFISRSLGFLAAYTTLVDKRILRLQLICRGIWDSFTGHLGRLNQGKV
ncbi:glycosyltransferase family 2 protein [Microvirga sp. VF16]|uniref:glycosyltransferase family 2 protein n=1 Tax=Microvirga sp. VF16 TaxID=2807101 RepID=UPI00193D941B|nr:glycosyltransferase family 2 protein [Microvirga sp. VF16]QRM28290.1 glycosyltransferase family 2 protein [Microvirga sp. VF16]